MASFAHTTIAVVDDDDGLRDSLVSLIRSYDHPVESFASAAEFLALRHADRFYFLVLDVQMPGMSGLELQSRLCKLGEPYPIVFVSACDDERTRAQARRAGALDFLDKPLDADRLMSLINASAIRPHGGGAQHQARARAQAPRL